MKNKALKYFALLQATLLFAGCGTDATGTQSTTPATGTEVTSSVSSGENTNDTEITDTSDFPTEAPIVETTTYAPAEEISSFSSFEETWDFIKKNGFADNSGEGFCNYSLAFSSEDFTEADGYYEQKVAIYEAVTVPADLKVGDSFSFDVTYAAGAKESITLTLQDENYNFSSTSGEEFTAYSCDEDPSILKLFYLSDDPVESVIATGYVRINKDANVAIPIENNSWQVRKEDLVSEYDPYTFYNGICFGNDGMIVELAHLGD